MGAETAFDPWSAAAQAASGLFSGITGLIQKHKAKKLLENTPYPTYEIPKEVLANQALAQTRSNQGLPSAQYNQAMRDVARNSNNAIRRANDRRGGLALISTIQQGDNDASLNLNVADAKARVANQNQLYDINNQVAGYKDKAFDWNQKQKYDNNYNYAMQLMGAGNQNFSNGIDRGIAGVTQYGAGAGFFGNRPRRTTGYSLPPGYLNDY